MKLALVIVLGLASIQSSFAQAPARAPMPQLFRLSCYLPSTNNTVYRYLPANIASTQRTSSSIMLFPNFLSESPFSKTITPLNRPNEPYRKCEIIPLAVFLSGGNSSVIVEGNAYDGLTPAEQNQLMQDISRMSFISDAERDDQISRLEKYYEENLKRLAFPELAPSS